MSRTLLMGLIIGLGASLGGCGVVSSFNQLGSDDDMGKSEAAYKQYLADHPGRRSSGLRGRKAGLSGRRPNLFGQNWADRQHRYIGH